MFLDIQSKNMVQANNHVLYLVNHEIIVPQSRMWDIYWLFVLDDFGTGVRENRFLNENQNPQAPWTAEFRTALQCYMNYCNTPFTKEEILLFYHIGQIKAAMIASSSNLFGDRAAEVRETNISIVTGFNNSKEIVRNIFFDLNPMQ